MRTSSIVSSQCPSAVDLRNPQRYDFDARRLVEFSKTLGLSKESIKTRLLEYGVDRTVGLKLRTQVSADVFIVECEGRIVFGDEGAILRERVGGLLSGTPKVVMDLRKVEHIDSGGIGILVGFFVSARNRGGDLKLVSPNRHVTHVLQRTKLDSIFAVYKDCDEAVAAFHTQVS